MPALPLTKDQLDDAARLKDRFLQWQKRQREAGLPSSQEAASEQLGFNQSSMSQYLNGKIPLNIDAVTRFAELLSCNAFDLSPAIADQAAKYALITQGAEPKSRPEQQSRKSKASEPRPSEQIGGGAESEPRAQAVANLQWITEQEAQLLSEFRQCGEAQKRTLLSSARGLPKAKAITIARNKA